MKKAAVIGSNSFSGSDFVDLLLKETECRIIGISRSPERNELFLPYKMNPALNRFSFYQLDLNKDMKSIQALLTREEPDYVINFAAQSEVAPSWQHPEQWFQTNSVALAELSNYLRKQQWLERYVHISSPEVYGTCEDRVREDQPFDPNTPYAASKAAGDLMLFTLVKNFNFPVVIIRATNVYGPHQQLFKIIPRTIIYLKTGRSIKLHGGGRAVKSYIHIRDVSRGELAAMERGTNGLVYHLSPESGIAVCAVVRRICLLLGKSFEDNTEIVSERLGQDRAYLVDSTRARNEFGWRPRIDLDEGLEEVIRWVQDNLTEIQRLPLEYIHKM